MRLKDYRTSVSGPTSTTSEIQRGIKFKQRARPRTIPYRGTGRYGSAHRAGWIENIYDLSEINRAEDVESALRNSFRRHREMVLKEGFILKCKNPRILKRIKQRIQLIEFWSNRSFKSILREVAQNLIKFHTAFIYKRRDATRSSGHMTRVWTKEREPIAALEVVDPCSMEVRQNKVGGIAGWRQRVREQSEEVEFAVDEIICITMDKKTGFVFGTPYVIPVLDDILALRRLEELVEIITNKHAFPLYQYKVGTKERPCGDIIMSDGSKMSEIDVVRAELGDMPTEGGIVTSERHEIVVIGAEGQAMNVQPYLEYFKARVNSGLRLSVTEQGGTDSQSKGSATVAFKNMGEAVRDYQDVIADEIGFQFLNELVLEEGFDLTDENKVELEFPNPDREEERAHQNHHMTLYQGHVTTEDEARAAMGMDPVKDQKKLYLNKVEIPLAKAGKTENKATSGAKGTAKSKAKPTNKTGSKVKPRTPKNDIEWDMIQVWDRLRRKIVDSDDAEASFEHADAHMLTLIWPKISSYLSDYEVDSEGCKRLLRKELRKITSRAKIMLRSLDQDTQPVFVVDALKPLVLKVGDDIDKLARAYVIHSNLQDQMKHSVRDIARSL